MFREFFSGFDAYHGFMVKYILGNTYEFYPRLFLEHMKLVYLRALTRGSSQILLYSTTRSYNHNYDFWSKGNFYLKKQ